MDLWHFSRQRGRSLLRHVRRHVDYADPVLDLGCGSGHLLQMLVDNRRRSFAADVGSTGLEMLTKRHATNRFFQGAKLMPAPDVVPFDNHSVATVFLLETIEHLLPETLDRLLAETARVLAYWGTLVITTPYRENLDESEIVCSACGCAFHKTQHISSFDEKGVSALVEKAGLSVINVSAPLLLPDPKIWIRAQVTPARVSIGCPECGAACRSPNHSLFARGAGLVAELKHLVCIARKTK